MNKNTYWSGSGKYQEQADKLNPMIPRQGEANKFHIEIYRIVVRLYYDYYNNGFGNFDGMNDWYNYLRRYIDVFAHIATAEAYCIYDAFEAIDAYTGIEYYDRDDAPRIDGAMENLANVITRWAWGVEAQLQEEERQ